MLKNYFMSAAKEVSLIGENPDEKKIAHIVKFMNKSLSLGSKKSKHLLPLTVKKLKEGDDPLKYFRKLEKKINKLKRSEEEYLISLLKNMVSIEATSTSEKMLKELIHEIWTSVVPISCPHCQGKSPGIRKDGYTKLFVKPLSERLKQA